MLSHPVRWLTPMLPPAPMPDYLVPVNWRPNATSAVGWRQCASLYIRWESSSVSMAPSLGSSS
jgi:hypothetical protein